MKINKKDVQNLIALYNQSRFHEAQVKAESFINANPQIPFLYNFLGAVYTAQGFLEKAAFCYRKAIRIDPNDALSYFNLGVTLNALGETDGAIENYRKAITITPDAAKIHYNLGNVLESLGRHEEAVESYRKAITYNNYMAEAYNGLGSSLKGLGRLEEAIASYRKAINLKPDMPESYYNLGVSLNALGEVEGAIDSYRKAIAIKPDYVKAHRGLGNALRWVGKTADAVAAYQKALSIKPDDAACYYDLSMIRKVDLSDPEVSSLYTLYESSKNESERVYLSFALAKINEDSGAFDKAFSFYVEGNRLRKKELNYHIEQDRQLFENIKSFFRGYEQVFSESSFITKHTPIFIVGMPRSGTSLVEQIFASHSKVYGAGELRQLGSLVSKHIFQECSQSGFDLACSSRKVLSGYMEYLSSIGTDRPYITDKMPFNFLWVGFLLLAQPKIKVLNLVRDPRAVCWSLFKHYFPAEDGIGFAYDFEDIAEFLRLYEDLMQFWRERFPGCIYDVIYEDLTKNQEEETRKFLRYCNLEWEDQCLEFYKTKRVVRTASAEQVRNRIYRGSSDAWRKYEKHLAPYFSSFA